MLMEDNGTPNSNQGQGFFLAKYVPSSELTGECQVSSTNPYISYSNT